MKAQPETIKEAIAAAERERNMVAAFCGRYGINMAEYDREKEKRVRYMLALLHGEFRD